MDFFKKFWKSYPKTWFCFDHFDWGLLQRSCYLILEIETYRFPVCSFVFLFIILNDILRFIKIQYWFVNHYIFITKNINKLQKIVGWNLPLNFGATFQLIFAPEVISDKKNKTFIFNPGQFSLISHFRFYAVAFCENHLLRTFKRPLIFAVCFGVLLYGLWVLLCVWCTSKQPLSF